MTIFEKYHSVILYHKSLSVNEPGYKDFRKHWGKKENASKPAFSFFPTMFSNLSFFCLKQIQSFKPQLVVINSLLMGKDFKVSRLIR